ncbi:hypothetical protein EJB05_32226 [Eragrostis curvula]|uniref:Secreted protein n=1 Tax=Eragrostis curvula TaxID=38414 RepID=A0A5J9UH93_9POAL|nr:hypothetical protein EJB05_32226 [Eragrostis curvula]
MVLVWVLRSVLLCPTNLYGAGLGAVGGGACTQGEAPSLPIATQDSGPRSAEAHPLEREHHSIESNNKLSIGLVNLVCDVAYHSIGCCRCPTHCTDQQRTSWCRVNQLCASLHGGLNGKHKCDSAQQQWDYEIRYTDQGSSILINEAVVTSSM